MSSAQRATLLPQFSEEAIRDCAQRVLDSISAEIPGYSAVTDPGLLQEFANVSVYNARLCFTVLSEDRAPTGDELRYLEATARRRMLQGLPLETVLQTYRLALRAHWQYLTERLPDVELGSLAIRVFEYADHVSTAAAQAYVQERERLSQSRQEAIRMLLTRVLLGELDQQTLIREGELLGYDFSRANTALLLAVNRGPRLPKPQVDQVLADAQREFAHSVPHVLTALLPTGLLIVVPGDSTDEIELMVQHALPHHLMAPYVSISVGTPRVGAAGLVASYDEARRAMALGAIASPNQRVQRYQEVRFFDLFKDDRTIGVFVTEVLGPLLNLKDDRSTKLLDTLTAYFSADLSRKRAAHLLGVHLNTLAYRIRLIEKLLGGSLASAEFIFRIHLALKLMPLTRGLSAPGITG